MSRHADAGRSLSQWKPSPINTSARLDSFCYCDMEGVGSATCPARARDGCEGLQRAREATDGGSSWMGGSSSSSMRGFLMWDSGLVRGVTLFLLIKVPGPLFTSYCRYHMGFRAGGSGGGEHRILHSVPLVCLCGCSLPPHSGKWTPPCTRRPLG